VRRHASAGTIAEPDVGRRHDLRTEGVDDGKSQSPECEDPLELSHIDLAAPVLEPGDAGMVDAQHVGESALTEVGTSSRLAHET